MLHFVRSKNLPFSTQEVKDVCSSCRVCAEIKPRFHKPDDARLIKATRPMERLSVDFKGPISSSTRNIYIFTAVDEYSRFPFAIPCSDMTATTIVKCLDTIFSLCGMAAYVHSDRGKGFLSQEVHQYLHSRGISSSRATPYHPLGNSQVERYNGIIWRAVQLAVKSYDLSLKDWESVLPQALHSVRSLLSTSTNETPHERFFRFERRSCQGTSLPTWLMTPGPVLLRRHVRSRKDEPLVDVVELLDSNISYAVVKHPDGRSSTVSIRDLAPYPPGCSVQVNDVDNRADLLSPASQLEQTANNARADDGESCIQNSHSGNDRTSGISEDSPPEHPHSRDDERLQSSSAESVSVTSQEACQQTPRRSARARAAPDRYGW